MKCSYCILAGFNIVVNLAILLLALVALSVGIAGVVLVNTHLSASGLIIYINGLFIFVVLVGTYIAVICMFGIIGSYAAYNSSNKILKMVSICLLLFAACGMLLVLIVQIVGIAVATTYRSEVQATFTSSLLTFFNDTFTNSPDAVDDVIVPFQTFFDCCGVSGPEDYEDIPAIGDSNPLPEGCCRSLYPSCTLSNDSSTYRSEGCASVVIDITSAYFNAIIGVGVVIMIQSINAVIMPLGLVWAKCFKKEDGGLKVV